MHCGQYWTRPSPVHTVDPRLYTHVVNCAQSAMTFGSLEIKEF